MTSYEKKLGLPLVLLMLSMLGLLVSLWTLFNSVGVLIESASDLNTTWQGITQTQVFDATEQLAVSELVVKVNAPIAQLQNAARWSLGLGLVSLLLIIWVLIVTRDENRKKSLQERMQEQNEQAAVMRLVDEMAPLASGDLRVQASVGETMTGALAESFNYTVAELKWLVSSVGVSTQQLNDSLTSIHEASEAVSKSCSEQSHQVHRSSNHLLAVGATTASLSADTAESSIESKSVVENSESCQGLLKRSLGLLTTIHEEAINTTRSMQRLADNVAAIDERVMIIQDVAKQTDLLALNTTIKASAGSREGSSVSVADDLGQLSDEVAQLAEVLGQATRDIGSLTRSIAEDAADTVASMEVASTDLNAGLTQVQEADGALSSIKQSAIVLQEKLTAMSNKTVEQTSLLRKVTANLDLIHQLSQQTHAGVSANVASITDLKTIGSELQQGLSGFMLPEREIKSLESGSISAARRAAERAVLHG